MVSSVLKTTPAVYFDCNATTPVLPIAAQAALSAMEKLYGNPSSTHITGLQAKYLLETTRRKASKLLNCQSDEVVFTSGATEAIQMAVFSALYEAAKNIREGKQKFCSKDCLCSNRAQGSSHGTGVLEKRLGSGL